MRFFRRSLMGLFLLALTAGLMAAAFLTVQSALMARNAGNGGGGGGAREREFTVTVVTATPGALTPELAVFGEIRAQRRLDIRAAVSGRIAALAPEFVDGGQVEAGQLLVRLDPADASSELARAQNSLQEAAATLRDAQQTRALAREDLQASEAQLELRTAALDRQVDLRARGVGTAAVVEAAELAVSQAQQARVSRRQAIAQAEARVDSSAINLSRQELAVADARRKLQDTEIRAPFSGKLGGVNIVRGGLLSANERLAVLTDPAALEVAFRVSTAQYTRLLRSDGALEAAPVEVVLDVLGADLLSSGTVVRESGTVEAGLTGRLLFASIAEPGGFQPGDFVTVRVREPALENVVLLPATAWDPAGHVLVVAEGDRLARRNARLVRRQGNDVIVDGAGLARTDVVTVLSPLLGAGIKVRPRRSTPQSGDAGLENEEPETITLAADRRAVLVAFVEANTRMPEDARARVLGLLAQAEVPIRVVERIESRMGGE